MSETQRKELEDRNPLAAPWLGLSTFTAMGPGSVPGQGTKVSQVTIARPKQKQMRGLYIWTPALSVSALFVVERTKHLSPLRKGSGRVSFFFVITES